jgi:methylated-DNA-[protein]-cysteine S-methyltransferase
MMRLLYDTIPSPVGEAAIVWREEGGCRVVRILLAAGMATTAEQVQLLYPSAVRAPSPGGSFTQRIHDFLRGATVSLDVNLLEWEGCSGFQKNVLLKAGEIPRGMVASYGQLAELAGVPRAARAAGTALAGNPFPLLIPCHRVVRSTGDLGRFGGGTELKKALLAFEGVSFDGPYRVNSSCLWTG